MKSINLGVFTELQETLSMRTEVPAAAATGELLRRLAASAQVIHDPASGIVWRRWGDGPATIVLLHGSAGSWTHWLRNIEALAERASVWAPDLPGCGDSPDNGVRSYVDLAGQLLASLEQLDVPAGAMLVGFSFGSVLAEAMALLAPARWSQLVLVRGSFDGQTPPFPRMRRWKGLPADEELAAHRHNLAVAMLHDAAPIDDDVVQVHADNLRRACVNPLDYTRQGMEESLTRLAVPAIAVRGEFDPFGLEPAAQRAAWNAAQPGRPFHVLAGAGHWASYESAPAFNALLLAALCPRMSG